ncbi:cytochrome-c oxidase, cbb3-type subunit III [Pokkaliibacter sp. MBI-7]|uniref:cytochrome-c oxidase, cbb3-type subunit III n=1 Tax=Pokkaliibacter sp. MBI-7 TaxID=3040600 RepID=UPI002448CB13|nr:cytochrome-c oxidase, cbb3-type subunit III [Pokkaliibacter sp. MBI-7]MDH2435113.1 cytochrome-c oxidase, cbb3-type subunit III [Pokkaliibacter sp. MBI-7]
MNLVLSVGVTLITLAVILGCFALVIQTRKSEKYKEATEQTLGHEFDGIEEYDNPLPRWWFNLFVITIVFGLVYLMLYPGLGNFQGLLGWSSKGQYNTEMAYADEHYKPVFEKYAALPIEEAAKNPVAVQMGQRLFLNNCAVCHGSQAQGGHGFPNLGDNDWLYGGAPDTILATITNGRTGGMPAWGDALGEDGIEDVANYVLSLSDQPHNADAAARGQANFQALCTACHGPDGKGQQALGAPNLTDNIWLYGGSFADITQTLRNGRAGAMPAHKDLLSADKIKLLAAYVYSLSHK